MQGFKNKKAIDKKAHMAKKRAPTKTKMGTFKLRENKKLTAKIFNNIETMMMDKASHGKKRLKIVKTPKKPKQ